MADLIREAPIGQLIRFITSNKVLQYPEEKPGFQLPESYNAALNSSAASPSKEKPSDSEASSTTEYNVSVPPQTLQREKSNESAKARDDLEATGDGLQINREPSLQRSKSIPLAPTKTADGEILVDWYTTDDPANPQNWSNRKRGFVALIICLYTFAVYSGSAIYVSSIYGVMSVFNVGEIAASLPLALYVLAYGIGPLLFSPLSELPLVGRNPVYAVTFSLFFILSIPTALASNFAGLLVLRFLQGFLGSPCLATGGATMQDMYSMLKHWVLCYPVSPSPWKAGAGPSGKSSGSPLPS
ncbi:MAG: hypothetical protein Q9204_005968 [Flavoplaca sp. TL-2023a]